MVLGYKLLKILVTLKAKPHGHGVEKFGKILVKHGTELIGFIVGKQKVCVGGGKKRRTEEERSHCICSQAGLNRTQRGGLESGLDVAFWGGAR